MARMNIILEVDLDCIDSENQLRWTITDFLPGLLMSHIAINTVDTYISKYRDVNVL